MRRLGSTLTTGLVVVVLVAGVAFVWPKYGFCVSQTRADEVVCEIRRNLHLGPHLNWAFNRYTVESVLQTVVASDIPHLVEALGDERPAVRMAAGNVLLEMGDDAIEALRAAAESEIFDVRYAAQDALSTWEISESH